MATQIKEATAVAVVEQAQLPVSGDMYTSGAVFAHMQRLGTMFSQSSLVPAHLQGKIADCTIALDIALRMRESPIQVMQNIYFVSGRAGWKTEYMIARANKAGVFKARISWRSVGTGKDLAVTAFAALADTGQEVSSTVSYGMAEAEGWTRNAKYKTMPEHMLRWRSATMLIRLYCPEVMFGLPTDDELRDITPISDAPPTTAAAQVAAILAAPTVDEETGEIIETPPAAPLAVEQPDGAKVAMPEPQGVQRADVGSNGDEAAASPVVVRWIAANGREVKFQTVDDMLRIVLPGIGSSTPAQARAARERNAAILAELSEAGYSDQMIQISEALAAREAS